MKQFLYFLDDGDIRFGPAPDEDVLEMANDGYLRVVNLKTKEFYLPGDGWVGIEEIEFKDNNSDDDDMDFYDDDFMDE